MIIQSVATAALVQCVLLGNAGLSRRGGSSASASSGGGGWQVVDRSRQKAALEWLDYYPWVMSCNCLLDIAVPGGGATSAGNVEGWIDTLESFELPVPGSTPPEPPILTIQAPVPHSDLFWVITRLDFAGAETGQIRDSSGNRTQQGFTVEFTEYSPSQALSTSQLSPAQQAALNGASLGLGTALGQGTVSPSSATYTVVAGDTLVAIAARVLGNPALWAQLALANGLSNSAILTPGQVLTLPAT